MTDLVRRRGFQTDAGEAGFCEACGVDVPKGPDACLGLLAGVFAACCGHGSSNPVGDTGPGDSRQCYVLFIGEDGHPDYEGDLRGDDALVYFRALGKGPP